MNSTAPKYFIHESSYVDDGVEIGEDTMVWHFSHIIAGTQIGKRCNIGQNVVIGGNVRVGDGCKIQNNVSIYEGVELEDDVFCGPSMVFTNVFTPRSHVSRKNEYLSTPVRKGATIGANATIVCGNEIGAYAFIGAGAVVTKAVPSQALVVGNPAKQIGWMCKCGERLPSNLHCGRCDSKYQVDETVQVISEVQMSVPFIDLKAQYVRIQEDINAGIQGVLEHGKYILGPEVSQFEEQLADFCGAKHAISCSNGTDALSLGLMAYDVGPGDAIFTTPFTYFATAEVIALAHATPVFVDIDPKTFNIDPEKLREAVLKVKSEGKLKPRGIIPVNLFGLAPDFDGIDSIAKEHDLFVLEDAAQGFGGVYKGRVAGSLGDISTTSFFPAKPLGCYGDGGAVFTSNDALAEKMLSLRVHGQGVDKYDNVRIGLNARMDTLQAAILMPKLKIFPEEIGLRQQVAQAYDQALGGLVETPYIPEGYTSVWAQYSVLSDHREKIQAELQKHGIPSVIYYRTPCHLSGAFAHLGYKVGDMPNSEHASQRIFSLPMHPYVEEGFAETVAGVIRSVVAQCIAQASRIQPVFKSLSK